jgi:hypothetical protein
MPSQIWISKGWGYGGKGCNIGSKYLQGLGSSVCTFIIGMEVNARIWEVDENQEPEMFFPTFGSLSGLLKLIRFLEGLF